MRAYASARAEHIGGQTRLVELRSEAPLVLRATPHALYLVGGAAGPLGGDDLALDLAVGCGACIAVRSAAATLAQPGPQASPSRTTVRLDIGDAAIVDWHPEPLISVQGSDHLVDTTVTLARSARLTLVDEIVLGRAGEPSGRIRVRCRVSRDGASVLAHDLDLGPGLPGWDGAAVMGGARALISTLRVGPDAPTAASVAHSPDGSRAAWMPLAREAALLLAVGPTLLAARRASDEGYEGSRGS
ncbi:MAG TPA: urease accessory protein UreD [Acidimicrobiales bacterium]|nr:urease accessory protein UreD [Acidimicrobiales bacterium]